MSSHLHDALSDLVEVAPGVFYAAEPVVVSAAAIAFLRERATTNPRLRAMLCTHPSPTAVKHDMLMVQHGSCYGRPHFHRGRSEAFHVIEGEILLAIFDASGAVTDAVRMSSPQSGAPFYYRLPPEMIHCSIILSEWLVLHESTLGPFDPSTTVFPAWAPDESDAAAAGAFVAATMRAIDELAPS